MFPFFHHKREDAQYFFISSIKEREGLRIIRLKGDIDMATIPEAFKFMKKMQSHPDFRYKSILVDFKNVTNLDTAAIAVLIAAISELKKTHHKLGVINLKERFRDEIQIHKVDKLFAEYPTESDAVKDLISSMSKK